ncbi:MAG: energy-coupling factor transporter transmembrane component T family protein, partial [Acidimicrobiales bacterium]
LWVIAALAVALAGDDPVARGVVLAAAWVLLARRRLPGKRLRGLGVALAVFFGIATVTDMLLSHTGNTVLVTLPSWLPFVGGTITLEAAAYGATIALGLTAAVSSAAVLSYDLEPSDLVDGLPRFMGRTAAAVGTALNLLPALAASALAVQEAQRLRGWRPRGVRQLADIAVPVVVGAIERSVQLAESMEARAFGSGRRTRCFAPRRTARDLFVGVASLGVIVALVAIHAAGAAGSPWYPYPTPSAPQLNAGALGPALGVLLVALAVGPEG